MVSVAAQRLLSGNAARGQGRNNQSRRAGSADSLRMTHRSLLLAAAFALARRLELL